MQRHDMLVARLAEVQAGHVSRAQLHALGLTDPAIRRRLRDGRLLSVDTGVHRLAGAPPSWDGQLLAAVLRFGPSAAVSHRAAAVLLGLDVADREPPIDVLVERGSRERWSRTATVHSSVLIEPLDLAWVRRDLALDAGTAEALRVARPVTRIRTTSAARTIILLASCLSAHELGNVIDSATASRLVSEPFLRRRIAVHRGQGHRGVRLLDEMMLDAGGHSWLERRFLRLLRTEGLPRPRCQVAHRMNGELVARVDFEFTPHPLVVEVSGRVGHSSAADRRRDARRRNMLQERGYTVLEFVTADVIDTPQVVVATVRRALQRFSSGLSAAAGREI